MDINPSILMHLAMDAGFDVEDLGLLGLALMQDGRQLSGGSGGTGHNAQPLLHTEFVSLAKLSAVKVYHSHNALNLSDIQP